MGINDIFNAIRTNNIIHVTSLLKSGIDINIKDENNNNDYTPLHYCIVYADVNIEIIKLLLNHKDIDVNVKDKYGYTPLHCCVNSCNINIGILKLLLNHKDIDINSKSNCGNTPLHFCILYSNNIEIIKLLINHKNVKKIDSYPNLPSSGVLDSSIDINARNNDGYTPLHCSIDRNSNIKIIKLLLNHKDIDINTRDNDGCTPLHKCIIKNIKIDIIKLLLSHKDININIPNNRLIKPLSLASRYNLLEVVKILFEKGVEFNYFNISKNPSYNHALRNDHMEIVLYMEEMIKNYYSDDKTNDTTQNNIQPLLNNDSPHKLDFDQEFANLLKEYNISEFENEIDISQDDDNINEGVTFEISNINNFSKDKLIILLKKYKIYNFRITNKIEENIVKQIVKINI